MLSGVSTHDTLPAFPNYEEGPLPNLKVSMDFYDNMVKKLVNLFRSVINLDNPDSRSAYS